MSVSHEDEGFVHSDDYPCSLCDAELGIRPRSEWTLTDYAVEALCRVMGCRSVLGVHWRARVGYPLICNPLCLWLFDRDERREVRRG